LCTQFIIVQGSKSKAKQEKKNNVFTMSPS
jgi:hypothetical protein